MRNHSPLPVGKRPRLATATVAWAALMLAGAGCGEATRPAAPPEVIGTFDLAQVDGRPLPQVVTYIADLQCALTQATLRLTAGRKWDWVWTCVGQDGAAPTEYGMGDWFEQPAADSIVFPTNAPTVPAHWGAGRVRGDLLEIATMIPAPTGPPGVVAVMFGDHQWTFRRR